MCQTQTLFSQTTTSALSVGRPCTYAYMRNKHQCCYLSIFTLQSLFWNEKKRMWGITFWATFVVTDVKRYIDCEQRTWKYLEENCRGLFQIYLISQRYTVLLFVCCILKKRRFFHVACNVTLHVSLDKCGRSARHAVLPFRLVSNGSTYRLIGLSQGQ
jgi:hypothetical protein